MEPERISLSWISGSEGAKFSQTVTEITEKINSLGPNKKMRDDL